MTIVISPKHFLHFMRSFHRGQVEQMPFTSLPSPLSPPPSHAFFWLIIILKSPLIGPYEMTQAGPDDAIRPYAQPREMWHRATKKTNKLVAI